MKIIRTIGLVMLGFVLFGALAITAWGVRAYKQPLGPSLVSSIAPSTATASLNAATLAVNNTSTDSNSSQSADSSNITSTPAPTAVCGESSAWNILLIGSDADELRYIKGSDFTRIMLVDFPNRKVTLYAFPRDLWVDTWDLGLTNHYIDSARLGTVFYEARVRSPQSNKQGTMIDATGTTARMLYNNFSVSADHYFSLDLSQLPVIVDAIGGIPINIPVRLTDPNIGLVIESGQQTLNGAQVKAYVRALPDTDFNRIRRNSILLEAVRQKLLDPATWVKIPQLYSQFKDVFATDLSPEQIDHLSCMLKEVPNSSIIQEEVNPGWTSPGPAVGSLRWDKVRILNQLKDLGFIQ